MEIGEGSMKQKEGKFQNSELLINKVTGWLILLEFLLSHVISP